MAATGSGTLSTLTSLDLHGRLKVALREYQFQLADNRTDLNYVWFDAMASVRGHSGRVMRMRALNWELAALADALDDVATLRRSEWRSKLLDSGFRLSISRHPQRGDAFEVVVVVTEIGGPLPAFAVPHWDGDRLVCHGFPIEGARLVCSAGALSVFAAELRDELAAFPIRLLPKNRLHLGQPH